MHCGRTDVLLTLVNFQLDAQNSYLFTYNTFIKLLYMFRALPCSSSGGLRRNCIRGLLEKYPTFGREKETGLLGALDT
jgi:hypothetical protein